MIRLLMAIVAATLVSASMAAEMVTQAKTTAQIMIPAGKDGKAQFQGLKADALQMGLGEVVLNGVVEYQPQADTTTRVVIRWHAIGLTNATAVQSLTSPLTSQFRTADKAIPPGTVINVRGDLDLLAEDYLKLKARLAKESPKDTIKQTTNNNTSTDSARNANELGASGSSGSGSGSGSGNSGYGNSPYSTNNSQVKADLITSSWQDCQPRIDRANATVYQQARKLDVTESGKLMNTGDCEDHGSTSPVVRTYDGTCLPVVDVENRKVYHQFSESATLNDKKIDVSACTADFTKFDTVKSSIEGCGYRHDFTAGKSILQEKLYYNDLTGNVVSVRDCGDSSQAFAQYSTKNTCTPTIDNVNKQVFINVRAAFIDGNGAEQYASDCKPDGDASKPISEEFCTPKYENDFVNHVSYYRSRAYYVDESGNKIYVSECGRSSANSFPHIFETGSCGVRNDDIAKMTYWSKLTQIDTPTDGIVTIAPCQEMNSPTPYAYLGRTNGVVTTILSNVQTSNASLAQRLPSVDWSSGSNTFAFGGNSCWAWSNYFMSASSSESVAPTSVDAAYMLYTTASGAYGPITAYWSPSDSYGSTFADRVTKRPYLMRYLRADSTYYEIEDGAHYKVEIGCKPWGGSFAWVP